MSKIVGHESERKIAVIYARYSSDNQREESIDAQIRACKAFAEREGYEIVHIYTDEAVTAKNDKRDDFKKMMNEALTKDTFDYIIVHKFNRFARNKFDSVLYKKKLRDIGKRVVSATQKIDDTPEGAMLEGILEAMDEYYSSNLALEVEKGMRENALKGASTGGRPPLGYKYDENGFLVINEETAPLARKIFNMYLEGYGTLSLANTLNELGYRTQTGNEWRSRTVSDMLSNEKYIGIYTYEMSNEIIRREDNHVPIIDMDTWNRVQQMKMERSKPRIGNQVIYSLTGKMFCAKCNGTYSGGGSKISNGSKGSKKNYYYVCANKKNKRCDNRAVNKEKVEQYLYSYILNTLLTDESIEKIATEFEAMIVDIANEKSDVPIDKLKKEKAKLKTKITKLLDLYLDDDSPISKDELKEQTDANKKRLQAIEKQIQSAQVDFAQLPKKEDALAYLHRLRASYDEPSKVVMKSLLDTFIEKIIVHHDSLEVTYKVDLDTLIPRGANGSQARPRLTLEPLFIKESVSRKIISKFNG